MKKRMLVVALSLVLLSACAAGIAVLVFWCAWPGWVATVGGALSGVVFGVLNALYLRPMYRPLPRDKNNGEGVSPDREDV